MSMQTMKQRLRQSIIAARQNMVAAERAECSREITLKLLSLPSYKKAGVVLGYMSFGAEFETGVWLRQAMQDGKQVLLPKVNTSTKQLEMFRVSNLQSDLAPGVWNIPEPIFERCSKVGEHEQVDFVLLPGVAFGRDGSRLGYGGGFYDKLLERICLDAHRVLPHPNPPPRSERLMAGHPGEGTKARQPSLVAAAYSMQIVNDIPQEATDRKVEWLITEHEIVDCGNGRKWLGK